MKNFKKIALKVLLALGAVALISLAYVYFVNYSEGTRSGTIMKISKKGVLFKTNEGQLDVGKINEPWDFSVSSSDQELIKQLTRLQQSGERIQLFYKEKFIQVPWRGETKYFVYKIEQYQQPE